MNNEIITNNLFNIFINKYEDSAYYQSDKKYTFNISPIEIFPKYYSDEIGTNLLDEIEELNKILNELQNKNLITIIIKNHEIQKICANIEQINKQYHEINRKPKDDLINKRISLYKKYLGINQLIDAFILEQIDFIKNKKNKQKTDTMCTDKQLPNVIKLLKYVINNTTPIYIRELSEEVFSNSKTFEREYLSIILNIIKKYTTYDKFIDEIPSKTEQNTELLAIYNIYKNPNYLYIKGSGYILYKDGYINNFNPYHPCSIESTQLNQIEKIIISTNTIITVENLSAYSRIINEKNTYIYLAGFCNLSKQKFIKQIILNNKEKEWKHFGDIDPFGFLILEDLKKKTGINIEPYFMNEEILEKYKKNAIKELSNRDKTIAKKLIKNNLYIDVLNYILNNNLKLEQEIIAFKENV